MDILQESFLGPTSSTSIPTTRVGGCSPTGYQVPTPNIQHLADQGVLFRHAFSAAPVCSGSRASLLTGEYCHTNGMLGLAHRGWALNDYGHHWVHPLRAAGYRSMMIGEQHISADPHVIGYDEVVEVESNHAAQVTPARSTRHRGAAGAMVLVSRVLRDPSELRRPPVGA